MEKITNDFIDIDALLREKNPKLHTFLPRFIINYIKKKLHQDFINEGISTNKDLYHLAFNNAAIDYLGAKVEWFGEENISELGGVIICSNHPLGGLDGIALIKAVSSRRKDIRFLVNDLLKNFKNFDTLFVAVNKLSSNTKESLKTIEDVYNSDEAVVVFPAGLVSRKQNGVIEDLSWKKSFISKAIARKKNIVPVFIDGSNTKFFYNLAWWRKRLGIKANIEMFLLADEMVKQKGKKIKIIFGREIPYHILDQSRSHLLWAQTIKKFVYQLKSNPKLLFEDFLKS